MSVYHYLICYIYIYITIILGPKWLIVPVQSPARPFRWAIISVHSVPAGSVWFGTSSSRERPCELPVLGIKVAWSLVGGDQLHVGSRCWCCCIGVVFESVLTKWPFNALCVRAHVFRYLKANPSRTKCWMCRGDVWYDRILFIIDELMTSRSSQDWCKHFISICPEPPFSCRILLLRAQVPFQRFLRLST